MNNMKKEITILILIIILFSTVVTSINTSKNNASEIELDKVKNKLNPEIYDLPPELETITKVIFNIKTSALVSISKFVVLLAFFLMLFYIIKDTLDLAPFLNKGWQKYAGSLIITLLISITGTINNMAKFFFSLRGDLEWIKDFGFFSIIIGIILAGIVLFCAHYVLAILKKKIGKEKEYLAEEGAKDLASLIKSSSKSTKNLSKKK